MGTGCYCQALCRELRFCGRNTGLDLELPGPLPLFLSGEFCLLPVSLC